MTKQVRRGVFETNSSSTHSVCVHANARQTYDTIVPDKSGKIVLTGGKFGWEWEKYTDAATKANYAAVHAFGKPADMLLLETVLKEHTGAREIEFAFTKDYESENPSYIDHQSVGMLNEWFTIARLRDFLFDTAVELRTGNDNSESPWFD